MTDHVPYSVAITALKVAGVTVVPREATAKKAGRGKVWSGRKESGELWTLTKNDEDSFTYTC